MYVFFFRSSKSWVSNSRSTSLYFAACGHICKLCMYYKYYTKLRLFWYITYVTFPRAVPRTISQLRVKFAIAASFTCCQF